MSGGAGVPPAKRKYLPQATFVGSAPLNDAAAPRSKSLKNRLRSVARLLAHAAPGPHNAGTPTLLPTQAVKNKTREKKRLEEQVRRLANGARSCHSLTLLLLRSPPFFSPSPAPRNPYLARSPTPPSLRQSTSAAPPTTA